MFRILMPAALMLGACSQDAAPENTVPKPQVDETTTAPAPAPATLEGGWRVAGIDGAALDEPYGIGLMADGEEIWWEPRCAGFIFSYAIDGNSIRTGPRTSTPPASTSTPAPVCAIGLPPRLGDVSRAIQSAERIERTPENGVRISGGGYSVTLFSQ